ncbi:hypothetical protein GCM10007916_29460 [Psychromonas marina]|uniref:Uncharacterized protein n=1 Tax=Psychromonas marina TaxID=88364 RepID=A0ABQ6E4E8_9GAMM|nr:hypothetical protein GCM10007916_29460 [Psychromonas marina]
MIAEKKLIRLLKISITVGLSLIALGIYLHMFSPQMEELGVTGIIISASCIALGFIFSLPTKIYLTILLMKQEAEKESDH